MLLIGFAIIIGLVISYFAYQNSMLVTVVLGSQIFPSIPLYIVVIISVSIGFLVGLVFNLLTQFSSQRRLGKSRKTLDEKERDIIDLTKRVHKLEFANKRLRKKKGIEKDEDSL